MDVNNFSSKAEQIDQFLRNNNATNMAIIIHNNNSLLKLLDLAVIMFIPSDFALDKITQKSGKTLNEIRNTKEFIDLISNNFSILPLQDIYPAYTSVTGVTIGNNIHDLNSLDVIANITINNVKIYITNKSITTPKQLEKLAIIRQPGVMGLLDYQNFFNIVNIGQLKGKDLISFCLSDNTLNDMCNREDVIGENIFDKLIKRDFNIPIPQGKTAREYYIKLTSGYKLLTLGGYDPTGHGKDLVTGEPITVTKFTPINGFDNVISVSCGHAHAAIVKSDGSVWTFGRNDRGQLGLNTPYRGLGYHNIPFPPRGDLSQVDYNSLVNKLYMSSNVYSPVQILSLVDIKKVSCQADFTAILDEYGGVYVCGTMEEEEQGEENDEGEWIETKPSKIRIILDPLKLNVNNIVDISCGYNRLGMLDSDNRVWIYDLRSDDPIRFETIRNIKSINFYDNILLLGTNNDIYMEWEKINHIDMTTGMRSLLEQNLNMNFVIKKSSISIEKILLYSSVNTLLICLTTAGQLIGYVLLDDRYPEGLLFDLNFTIKDISLGISVVHNQFDNNMYSIGYETIFVIDTLGNVYYFKPSYNLESDNMLQPANVENMDNVIQISTSSNLAAILKK